LQTKKNFGLLLTKNLKKTAVVLVESLYSHPIYKKTLKTSKRFLAHDELNECNPGDQVVISETRPLSRNKRWMIKEILKKTLLSN
jgi:small subunit ribosomal protein S17